MYTSLDRIDIVTKDKETGRPGYFLTDHRTAVEIQSEPELSVLFALIRVRAGKVMGEGEGGADVVYVCQEMPPEFLREAIASAGGTVTLDTQSLEPVTAHRPHADIADEAFHGLARRVAQREGQAIAAELLLHLEEDTLSDTPVVEDDESRYWSRVLELAAVCGELLREKTGGRWTESMDANGIFPFGFTAGHGTFNAADKARRFMEQGEPQRPSQLLLMADDFGEVQDGPLMVNLKPGDTPREQGVCRELFEGAPANDHSIPLVFAGNDHPNSFAYLPVGSENVDESFDEALRNLARIQVQVETHEIAGLQVLVVGGDFYASEKILDESFMKGLHQQLEAELLAAAVPYKGLLLVTREVAPPMVAGFLAAARSLYTNTRDAPPLSPTVFLVKDGNVVGHLATGEGSSDGSTERPAHKRGFWSRLFGTHS